MTNNMHENAQATAYIIVWAIHATAMIMMINSHHHHQDDEQQPLSNFKYIIIM